ncbi:bleomycin resistance protein [Terricaulis silvestris]|uniref:CL990 resistance protein n=1 Tax=Terricaulis silvestris TaxID=2686094 RepID=A0A6I6MUA3_9CAUL|nr:bleomycin resistance protein [Terricaulis silvestris]QGZ97036.1 CL990 resistance protein [Terricaulis silvestris]
MPDRITANLPAINFDATEAFYAPLGFTASWKDSGWMILRRGSLELEFFPFPDLDPFQSSFSACIRVDDLDALYADFSRAGVTNDRCAIPRLTPPLTEPFGLRLFALIDLNGSLLRCIDNKATERLTQRT